MARKEKDIEVGTLRVRISQLGAGEAPLALARVGRLAGGALTAGDMDPGKIAVAFFRGFNDGDFIWLRDKFFAHAKKLVDVELSNGNTRETVLPLKLEEFDGNLDGQLQFIVQSVQHNFADFLGGLNSSLLRGAESTRDASSSPPTTSTGSSGGS